MKILYPVTVAICCSINAQAAIPPEIENAFVRYIELAQELEPILAAAQDKESAEANAKALYDILPRVYEARTELLKIESLPQQVQAELIQKYGKAMQTEWGKVYEHIFRLEKNNCYHSLSYFKQFRALCMMLQQ
ncbi:MAG: hypothetical protein IKT79_00145 [Akkermansia sp.]|nr:hypothetical protein [Akkermansia sp.]